MMNDDKKDGRHSIGSFTSKTTCFVQECENGMDVIHAVLTELAKFANASVLVCDMDGRIFVEEKMNKPPVFIQKQEIDHVEYVEKSFSNQLKNIVTITWNLPLRNFFGKNLESNELDAFFALVLPLVADMERSGTIFLYKPMEFDREERIAAEFSAIVAALCLNRYKEEIKRKRTNQVDVVKISLDTLSYTELEAALEIFKELGSCEGYVVASQIARQKGITHSAIVNALRKLESGSIIESRSLGVKGTYIKVKNTALLDELKKLETR